MGNLQNFGGNSQLVRIGDSTFVVSVSANSAGTANKGDNNTHLHGGFEIQCLLEGELVLRDENTEYPLKAGDIAIIPPSAFHKSGESDTGYSRLTCEFLITPNNESSLFGEYIKYNRLLSNLTGIKILNSSEVISVAKYLYNHQNINSAEMFNKNISYLSIFLIEIFAAVKAELLSGKEPKNKLPKKKVDPVAERQKFIILNCILSNFSNENVSLKLEEELSMSARNTARIVKKIFGKTITELVLEYRMQKAKALIINTDFSLLEVAEKTGYKTYVAFFTAFKNYFGVSPKDFRSDK